MKKAFDCSSHGQVIARPHKKGRFVVHEVAFETDDSRRHNRDSRSDRFHHSNLTDADVCSIMDIMYTDDDSEIPDAARA